MRTWKVLRKNTCGVLWKKANTVFLKLFIDNAGCRTFDAPISTRVDYRPLLSKAKQYSVNDQIRPENGERKTETKLILLTYF